MFVEAIECFHCFFSCTDKQDFVHCGMSPLLPSPFQNDKIPMRENPIFPSGLGVGRKYRILDGAEVTF